jgi:hypothetical protein
LPGWGKLCGAGGGAGIIYVISDNFNAMDN